MPEITNRLNHILLGFVLQGFWSDGVMDILELSNAKFRPPSPLLRSCPPAGKGEAVGLDNRG